MNKTKRVLWVFSSLDYKAIEKYLEEMARKGWMLEKVGRFTAKFKRIDPTDIKFDVDIFKFEGAFSPENNEKALEYRRLCKEAGWTFITSQDHLQFFWAPMDADVTPLQNDEALEQEIVGATVWKKELISIILATAIFAWVMTLFKPSNYTYLLSYIGTIGKVAFPIQYISAITPIIYGLIRVLKAKRNIKNGIPIDEINYDKVKRRTIIFNSVALLSALIILVALLADSVHEPTTAFASLIGPGSGLIIGLILRYFIKKKGSDTGDSARYVIISIFVLIILMGIVNWSLYSLNNNYTGRSTVKPENYPIISISDLEGKSIENELIDLEFKSRKSPAVPNYYTYSEYWDDGSQSSLYVKYYEATNSKYADKIFNGIIVGLERGIRWRGMTIFSETITRDEKLKNMWGADEFAITEDNATIVVQKDNIVVYVAGDFDFKDENVSKLIANRFY